MAAPNPDRPYKPTESKYKGGAHEMYVTYDISRQTRSGTATSVPKVKRIYIAGRVKKWKVGTYAKRTGRKVRGVKIEYEQVRGSYERSPYTAKRGKTSYRVSPAQVDSSGAKYAAIVEVPKDATNVKFYSSKLPQKYKTTLQRVR